MQQRELDSFKHILDEMLRDALRPSLVNREEIAVENVPDAVDHSQLLAERDLAVHQIESKFIRVQNIRTALHRIADGSYGVCQMCEGEINLKRLSAVPWAAYCVRCQEMADKEQIKPEDDHLKALLHLRDVA